MKRTILLITILITLQLNSRAQNIQLSSKEQAGQYYRLGVQYKDGNGLPMDYKKAVRYFEVGANLDDAQSIYALAYMHYKGLGCSQNYDTAFKLFSMGAFQGKSNSMYFYGLCFRNGYGTTQNEDSAGYWLKKSAKLGYRQAIQELEMAVPENSNDSAKALVQQINNAAIPRKSSINRFQKVDHYLPSTEMVNGTYTGYLIQYDWSGQSVVKGNKLELEINGQNPDIEGFWKEGEGGRIPFQALLTHDSVVFKNTRYKRNDHYSPRDAILYEFQSAKLNMIQKGDTVFMAGDVSMYSPDRKEPSKPLFVALYKIDKQSANSKVDIMAVPNPFTSIINVTFSLPKGAIVDLQLLNSAGTIVYNNHSGMLSAGRYVLPIQTGFIAPGIYFVRLTYDNSTAIIKVVRE